MVLFETALVSSYRLSVVTFPLCTHFRDIAAFVPKRATFLPPPLVASKFPHVLLRVDGWSLSYEERTFGLIVRAIHQRHSLTGGRTDRETDDMKWQDLALHYSTRTGSIAR